MLSDSVELRHILTSLLPEINFLGVAKKSGQRVVYLVEFGPDNDEWQKWHKVVLKVSSGISSNDVSRLQREIRILNDLDTDSFPTLLFYDTFSDNPASDEPLSLGRLFVTIEEFIDGETLSNRISEFSNEAALISLVLKLSNALKLIWEQRPPIIHRDIKPENLMIRPNGEIVVIDLGIARVQGSAGDTATAAVFAPCTPCYSSPEQATNDKTAMTFKSDFFSIGTLMYELLSGTNPFVGNDPQDLTAILHRVCTFEPPALSEVSETSMEVSQLVEKLMKKQPYQRFRTPDLLLDSLIRIQEQQNGN